MEDARISKKLMRGNMYVLRKRGRPNKRWIQDTDKSLNAMAERNRKENAVLKQLEAYCKGLFILNPLIEAYIIEVKI